MQIKAGNDWTKLYQDFYLEFTKLNTRVFFI